MRKRRCDVDVGQLLNDDDFAPNSPVLILAELQGRAPAAANCETAESVRDARTEFILANHKAAVEDEHRIAAVAQSGERPRGNCALGSPVGLNFHVGMPT